MALNSAKIPLSLDCESFYPTSDFVEDDKPSVNLDRRECMTNSSPPPPEEEMVTVEMTAEEKKKTIERLYSYYSSILLE